jgi:type IV pilus assembly protein PilY1
MLLAMICGSLAGADDTELFVGGDPGSGAQPNVLLIIDNSMSMNELVLTQPSFDAAAVYPNAGCETDRVYWRMGAGQPPACDTDRWFEMTALKCNCALNAFSSSGFYTDNMAQYDSTDSARRWEAISTDGKDRAVECQDDRSVHGDGLNTSNLYARNGAAADGSWGVEAEEISWGSFPANETYTLYSGNYLNWAYGPTGLQTRLQVVKDVATDLLDSVAGINVGLVHFNEFLDDAAGSEGGRVAHALQDIATARTALQAKIDALTADAATPLSEALYESALYYAGRAVAFGDPHSVAASRNPSDPGVYASPLEHTCQKNVIVLLTDGEPRWDDHADADILALQDAAGSSLSSAVGDSCDVETYPPGFVAGPGGDCLDELAEFLHEGDFSPLPGRQNIATYTVGFTVDLPILADTAQRGGGLYYTANDTATLAAALQNIVGSVVTSSTTFTAPAVAVNAFNRTQNLSDLFIGVFRPSTQRHWPGNLKKYRLRASDAAIVDADGNPAVDPSTGFFLESSRSFWSAAADGAEVETGGAANLIPLPADRKVYTYLGDARLTAQENRIATANFGLTDALLGTGGAGDPTRDQVIDFINGLDLPDTNQNNVTSEPRAQLGDPLHAQPVSVVYGPGQRDGLLFFATNDGFLHALDLQSGVEQWAFVPPEFLAEQVDLYVNGPAADKHYGIDGNLRVQMAADGDGVVEGGEKVYLFFGMRRGGDFYYGLDVTNPAEPQLLWSLDGSDLPGVGQSWSAPAPTRIDIQGAPQNADKLVLVIGGGYEPDQDNLAGSTDTIGNSIYIVDSVSGVLLWHGGKDGIHKDFNAPGKAMDYSIPADVKVIDLDGNRFADRMYAADMGGQIWRFDIANGQSAANLVAGGVIAQLGSAPAAAPPLAAVRRFYYSPDVAIVSRADHNFFHIGIGSGHRAHPLSPANEDRFYALRDYGIGAKTQAEFDAITPVTDAQLLPITTVGAALPQGSPGWRLDLNDGGWLGEKVLAEARTIDNQVTFTTFRPAAPGNSCDPQLGTNRVYRMSLLNGSPVTNLDGSADERNLTMNDIFVERSGGILPAPQWLFLTTDADADGAADGADAVETNADRPRPIRCHGLICAPEDFSNDPVRTFWTEDNVD